MAAPGRFRILRRIWTLILLGLLVGGWGLAAAALHVVVLPRDVSVLPRDVPAGDVASSEADVQDNAPAGSRDWQVLLLPKERLSFQDVYVDTRGWTDADVARHGPLVRRLAEADKLDLLSHVIDESVLRRVTDFNTRRDALLPGS